MTSIDKMAAAPAILETVKALRAFVKANRSAGHKIALVPTMGALHEGHLSLITEAQKHAEIIIVSIFVNPTQFAPHEDLDAYPRTWDADLAKLTEKGVSAVFYPDTAEMYPDGFSTVVSVRKITESMEGAVRPGHFDGVATIVSKLLLQALPDVAVFGEKDYQQLCMIKRMTKDLNIPVNIIAAPIIRDENGLALSSRNAYLSESEYQIAIQFNKILSQVCEKIRGGENTQEACDWGIQALQDAGFEKVDYLDVRDADTLEMVDVYKANGRVLAVARCGPVRLLDNMSL